MAGLSKMDVKNSLQKGLLFSYLSSAYIFYTLNARAHRTPLRNRYY